MKTRGEGKGNKKTKERRNSMEMTLRACHPHPLKDERRKWKVSRYFSHG